MEFLPYPLHEMAKKTKPMAVNWNVEALKATEATRIFIYSELNKCILSFSPTRISLTL